MHTWCTHNTPTGRLHVLGTPKYSQSAFNQPIKHEIHNLTPPKTKFPKLNQAPNIFVPSPQRILQSPQVKTLLPKVMYQLNRSLNASTCKEVWLDGTRPWPFWLTLSFPDCSRLFLYLSFVVCVSMVLLSVAAGARAGSVTVVWGLGRRREKIAPEVGREKCVLNQSCPARSPPRTRLSMHNTSVLG